MYRQKTNDFSGLIENGTVRSCNGDQSPVLSLVDQFPGDRTACQQCFPEIFILFIWKYPRLKNSRGFAYCFFRREAIYILKGRIGVLNDAFHIGNKNSIIRTVNTELELLNFTFCQESLNGRGYLQRDDRKDLFVLFCDTSPVVVGLD